MGPRCRWPLPVLRPPGCNYLPDSFDVSSAILVFQQPAAPFIAHSRIEDSAGHGILRGWNGSDTVGFLDTNAFARVAGCTQTTPRDVDGRCPDSPPCPKSPWSASGYGEARRWSRRYAPGAAPSQRLKARLNDASLW